MPLKIKFKGTEKEKKFARRTIYPFKEPSDMRNRFLDLLILGEDEYKAIRKGKTLVGDVPVIVEVCKKNGEYESLNYINKSLHDKIALSLKPLNKKLSLDNRLYKLKVHKANDESILFSYGIQNNHPQDKIMVIRMFYSPEVQADSAR